MSRSPVTELGPDINPIQSNHQLFEARDASGKVFLVKIRRPGMVSSLGPVDSYDTHWIDGEGRGVIELEDFRGPAYLGRVRIPDGKGGWLPGIAMEYVDGIDMQTAARGPILGYDGNKLDFPVTQKHRDSMDRLYDAFESHGLLPGDNNGKNLMLTRDGDVRPIDSPTLHRATPDDIAKGRRLMHDELDALIARSDRTERTKRRHKTIASGAVMSALASLGYGFNAYLEREEEKQRAEDARRKKEEEQRKRDEERKKRMQEIIDRVRSGEWWAAGDLFVKGKGDLDAIDPTDVNQGALGDCYLIAALGALALQNPDLLREMMHVNDDGTVTVTFYRTDENGLLVPVPVTVSQDVLVIEGKDEKTGKPNGLFYNAFSQPGDDWESWSIIMEKAFAQLKGGYQNIGLGGLPGAALETLTGNKSEAAVPSRYAASPAEHAAWNFDSVARKFEQGDALVASSLFGREAKNHPLYQESQEVPLVGGHAYYVTDVDRDAGTITLHNPWGWDAGETVVTWDEFNTAFSYVHLTSTEEEG
jgi:hypothetical protein